MTAANHNAQCLYSLLILLLVSYSSCFIPLSRHFPRQAARKRAFGDGAQLFQSTSNQDDDAASNNTDDKHNDNEKKEPHVASFESMVRSVTGRSDYKFGDLTKGAVSTTTHAFEDVAKATHLVDDDYHFGDITKGAISSISKPVESYLSGAERTLHMVTDANIHELVALTSVVWNDNLDQKQREQTWIVGIHLAAIVVLAYNFIANLQSGIVAAVAWTRTSLMTGMSPLAPGNWAKFLQMQSTYNMFVGGPFLPVRAIISIKWFFPYRKFLVALQSKSPLQSKYPLLNRVACVLGMWAVVNLASVGVLAAAMVWVASLFTGIPVIPQ